MTINELLSTDSILCKSDCHSKKRALETAATQLGKHIDSLDENQLFTALVARERLGSTGLGNGIAIPHCHIAGIKQPLGMLITLDTPVDFDAIDSKPVDVLFVLVVPDGQEQQHLDTLAAIVECFSNSALLSQLRAASTPASLQQLLAHY